jgi:hypothetical protein
MQDTGFTCSATSGYIIEETFARVRGEFLASHKWHEADFANRITYSIPRIDVPAERMAKQYRGLQREPLLSWEEALHGSGVIEPTNQELEACLFLAQLEDTGRAECDIVFALEDVREVMRRITPPVEREIVWARRVDIPDVAAPPAGTTLLGYEPSEFYPPSCRSAIAERMFFCQPMLNDDDEEGLLFKAYHDKLNRWGLFDTAADAREYWEVHRSWLPRDLRIYEYHIVEVRQVDWR